MTSTVFKPPLYSFMLQQVPFFQAMHETRSLLVWPELGAHFVSANGYPSESVTIITPKTSPRLFGALLGREGYEESGNRYGPGIVFHNRDKRRTIFQEFVDEEQTPMQKYLLQRSGTTDQVCFLTSKLAVCVFPDLTLGRKFAFLGDSDEWVIRVRQAAGFSLADEQDQVASEMTEERRFGDSLCQIRQVSVPGSWAMPEPTEQIRLKEVFPEDWPFRLRKRRPHEA
jgi:hypothetical protein